MIFMRLDTHLRISRERDSVTLIQQLPDGWARHQVRSGLIGRGQGLPLPGFTVDLPAGWTTGELSSHWDGYSSHWDGFGGWIAANPLIEGDRIPGLYFSADSVSEDQSERATIRMDGGDRRSDIRRPVVEGIRAFLHLSRPNRVGRHTPVGVHFPRIPGSEESLITLALTIQGESQGFTDQEELARVLTSPRYADIDELPALPFLPALSPHSSWRPTRAREGFVMDLPPGWEFEARHGIDTLNGVLSNGELGFNYTLGTHSGIPMTPFDMSSNSGVINSLPFHSSVSIDPSVPPHHIWEEDIDGINFWFVWPVSSDPHPRAKIGVYVNLAPTPRGGSQKWSLLGPSCKWSVRHLPMISKSWWWRCFAHSGLANRPDASRVGMPA